MQIVGDGMINEFTFFISLSPHRHSEIAMGNIDRKDIFILNSHSNMTTQNINEALHLHVYHDKKSWSKFLRIFLIALGVGFTVAGIVFFFAYNWADLNKFFKIGLIESLVVITTALALYSRLNLLVRNIILTGVAVLVGVLFSVFGQVYQTGANAYDFFLAWTVFVTLWVVVSNFVPLWLLYLVLINTTLILYSQQVANNWPETLLFTLLFALNALVVVVASLMQVRKTAIGVPTWFSNTVALASVIFGTIGIVIGIFDKFEVSFLFLILLVASAYALGIYFGYSAKRIFFLSIIPFSILIIVSAFLGKLADDGKILFVIAILVIGTVTMLLRALISLQKSWTNEK